MMQKKILIVGGYGSVGRIVAESLGRILPGQVIAAGRSFKKAKQFSEEMNGQILPLEMDVSKDEFPNERLNDVGLVIMCLDQADTQFVAYCLNQGISYIDISANEEFLSDVEKLKAIALSSNASAILSVGLSPGITNLLAKLATSSLSDVSLINIFILLGLGDAHGEAAIRWTLDNLNKEFSVIEKGQSKQVGSFEDGMRTYFPGIGQRTAFRFNFSDQKTIARTLNIDSVSTRLSFDMDIAAKSFSLFKKLGLLNLLSIPKVRDILVRVLMNSPIGSEQYAIKLQASGNLNGQHTELEYLLGGKNESRGTGLVTAQIAKQFMEDGFPAGVFHAEEIIEPEAFIKNLMAQHEGEFDFLMKNNGAWQEYK